jgi:hypothetical protein
MSLPKTIADRAANAVRICACAAAVSAAALALGCRPTPPDDVFAELESRLLTAGSVNIDFHVTAEGVVTADLDGNLALMPDGSVALSADGTFAGEPATLRLASQGQRYTYGNATRRTLAPRPAELQRALLIGFTRMGILHNLARLSEEQPPDHADGGVGEWVVVEDFEAVRLPEPGIAFAIVVAGEPAGTAVLNFDMNGLPLERTQTVQFPSGEMRVTETYPFMTIQR